MNINAAITERVNIAANTSSVWNFGVEVLMSQPRPDRGTDPLANYGADYGDDGGDFQSGEEIRKR